MDPTDGSRSQSVEGASLTETDAERVSAVSETELMPGADLADTIDFETMAPGSAIGMVIGQCEIIRELGRGGMGAVFLARDTRLGRLVAVKVLADTSERRARRFLAEARATAQCKHENIVVIYDVAEHRGYPYMVLEYLEGQTLRGFLDRRRAPESAGSDPAGAPGPGGGTRARIPLPPDRAVELMIPVARALACAHELHIAHRDLKPSNIMLTDSGAIKVLDFGIAKLVAGENTSLAMTRREIAGDGSMTRAGTVMGTPLYMSPEQWRNQDIDHRVDLWAAGVILYEMVMGQHPLAPVTRNKLAQVGEVEAPMPRLGETRPELGALGLLIDRCLIKKKEDRIESARDLLAGLEELLPSSRGFELNEDESPFAGLAAFQRADSRRFFGRDRDVASLAARLRNQPLMTIAGPSGAGKSSFVRAGLIPALERSAEGWEAFTLRPGRHPLTALAEILAHRPFTLTSPAAIGEVRDRDQLVADLRARPGALGAELRARCRHLPRRIVVFVDQLEELYTLGASAGERAAFAACLEGVADDASSPLRVVCTVRSDFLDRLAEDGRVMGSITRALVFLSPIARDGLRQALQGPIEATGHRFETPDMVESMLDTLETTRNPLPLLQFAAARLWESRDRERKLLSAASYRELGGIAGALSAHADAVLAGLSSREQTLARAMFLQLVTPERTRAVVTVARLHQLGRDRDEVDQVIQHLTAASLVLIDKSRDGEGTAVELVHESLIERWPRLAHWLGETESDAAFIKRLQGAAADWQASGEPEGLLWRGRAAREAQLWRERYEGELAPVARRYLTATLALAQRSRRRRLRAVAGAFIALTAAVAAMSYLAWQQAQANRATKLATARIEAEAIRARDATRVAAARALAADPTSKLALLREIESPEPPLGWSEEAGRALNGGVARAVLAGHEAAVDRVALSAGCERAVSGARDDTVRVWSTAGSGPPTVLTGHSGWVLAVKLSPDDRYLAYAATDHIARVWRADGSGEPVVLAGHGALIRRLEFSPDGKRIVTASHDGTARVWSADGSGAAIVLEGHEGPLWSAAFDRTGTRVVTASSDKTVRVWNADGTGAPVVLAGHSDAARWAEISPDGTRVVSASHDGTIRVWSADGSGEPLVLRGHSHWVYMAKISADGRRIVSASRDRSARVWNADGSGEPVVLSGHKGFVVDVALSPDGKRVVTGSTDKTARIWNADGTGAASVLSGHSDEVLAVGFSPDGTCIATASSDHTVRIWSIERPDAPIVLSGHTGFVTTASFDRAGQRIVSTSVDGTVRVWNSDGSGEPVVLAGHSDRPLTAVLSPDGQRVVSAGGDGTVRVWRADGSGEPLVLSGHQGSVRSAALSPDGQRIVSASVDRTVRLWRVDGSGEPVILSGHAEAVLSARFSPDGKRVVSASRDGAVRVWPVDGSGEVVVLAGHQAAITEARFSPDGKRVASASHDKTVRVWSADGAGEPLVFDHHTEAVHSAAFSPDGRRVVSAAGDGTIRSWNADGSGEPLVFVGHTNTVQAVGFDPRGERIVSASNDGTVRVWNADGSGEPLVLSGHADWVYTAAFSPHGDRIVSASKDDTIRVWRDLEPLELDDTRLWTATTYCMPIEMRQKLLGASVPVARENRERCIRRAASPGAGDRVRGAP